MTFVLSPDQKEMTVLLLDTHNHAHHTSSLVVRGEECSGQCTPGNLEVARSLFPGKSDAQAVEALRAAVLGGGAWPLANAELAVQPPAGASLRPALTLQGGRQIVDGVPAPLPATSAERAAFSWIPNIKQVLPSFGEFNPQLFAQRPPQNLVAARLRLRNGTFSTAKLARIDGKVKPIGFRAVGSDQPVEFFQAVGSFAVANITVPGDEITFTATNFDDGSQRTMTLSPQNGVLEAAIFNLPFFEVPSDPDEPVTPPPATHWEAYYDLAATPAAADNRPVPYARPTTLEADYDLLHPRAELWSPLLDKLGFGVTRGVYDPILCPMSQGSQQ
ncbi:MAG TPA: hypothetical protein VHL59_05540 [Thermoanaerobaculia bacterium]|nr:hypothetical protein [Thermoanaerobaculia bacterium]